MRVLIGTYRRQAYVPQALSSLSDQVKGVDDLVFIDDSGDPENAAWLRTYGTVVEVGGNGYNAAMQAACEAAQGQECLWLEEDFTFLSPVNLDELSEMLYHRPYLAQIALLRGPHFPIEHAKGGLIEALEYKGHRFNEVDGLIEHTACFTGNPSVWRAHVFELGWPRGKWSEEQKGRDLVELGYRFAYLPGIRVQHHGERSGFDY